MAYLFQATVLFLSLANITKFNFIVLKTLWCGAEASEVGIIMRSRSSKFWLQSQNNVAVFAANSVLSTAFENYRYFYFIRYLLYVLEFYGCQFEFLRKAKCFKL